MGFLEDEQSGYTAPKLPKRERVKVPRPAIAECPSCGVPGPGRCLHCGYEADASGWTATRGVHKHRVAAWIAAGGAIAAVPTAVVSVGLGLGMAMVGSAAAMAVTFLAPRPLVWSYRSRAMRGNASDGDAERVLSAGRGAWSQTIEAPLFWRSFAVTERSVDALIEQCEHTLFLDSDLEESPHRHRSFALAAATMELVALGAIELRALYQAAWSDDDTTMPRVSLTLTVLDKTLARGALARRLYAALHGDDPLRSAGGYRDAPAVDAPEQTTILGQWVARALGDPTLWVDPWERSGAERELPEDERWSLTQLARFWGAQLGAFERGR